MNKTICTLITLLLIASTLLGCESVKLNDSPTGGIPSVHTTGTIPALTTPSYYTPPLPEKDEFHTPAYQLQLLADGFKQNKLHYAARTVMSQKAGIGWTTSGHTALPVLTTATGIQAKQFTGFIENTEISNKLKAMIR